MQTEFAGRETAKGIALLFSVTHTSKMWGSTTQARHEALSKQFGELFVARVNEADAFGNAEVGAKRQTQKG